MLVSYPLQKLWLWLNARSSDCFPSQNSHPQKRVNHQKCLWGTLVLCALGATFYLSQYTENEHSFAEACNQLHCPFSPTLQKHLLPCSASILLHHMQLKGSSLPSSFPGGMLAPCLSPLFHNGFHDGLATFLYSLHGCIHLSGPTGPAYWAHQAEFYNPCISQGEPFLVWSSSKEQDCPLGSSTTALVICSLRPSWKLSIINKPL